MVPEKDELLTKRVLYIGSAVPLETAEGLEGVQKPLLERYPIDNDNNIEGILSQLTIVKDGITLQYVSDPNRKLFFPISALTLCAAVRCVTTVNSSTGKQSARFVSLSNPAAGGPNNKRPAIFTTITRRTEGRKVLECHGFICSKDKDAVDLVQATAFVDRANKGKLLEAEVLPTHEANTMKLTPASTPASHTEASAAVAGPDGDHPIRLVAGGDSVSQRVAPEFYEPPPLHGYFYKTPDSLIKTYTVERVTEGESERLRAISANAPSTLPRGPASEKKLVYGGPPPGYMTLPPPQGRNMVPVQVIPPQNAVMRPRFFSPPPPMLRPHPVVMPPRPMVAPDPYVFMPPMPMMEPPYIIVNPSTRRRHSHSSSQSSSASSSPGSPRSPNGQEAVNGTGGDGSSDAGSRPHTPPTDYEKGPRVSRKEHFEHSQRHPRDTNVGPVHYSTLPGGPSPPGPHPYGMYMMYPPRYLGYPPYMMERARSVPPPMNRGSSRKSGKSKKDKKKKKKSGKRRAHGAPSDVSTDSVGYTSEVGPGGEYPRMPRDFRRFENQFKHERAFSKSLKEEGSKTAPQAQNSGNAYSLNERMSKRGDEFNLY